MTKTAQYYIAIALGGLSLVLSFILLVISQQNHGLQTEIQNQQGEINVENQEQQVTNNLVRDLLALADKDEKIKQLIGRNVQINAPPQPNSPPASSAPAATPAASPTP